MGDPSPVMGDMMEPQRGFSRGEWLEGEIQMMDKAEIDSRFPELGVFDKGFVDRMVTDGFEGFDEDRHMIFMNPLKGWIVRESVYIRCRILIYRVELGAKKSCLRVICVGSSTIHLLDVWLDEGDPGCFKVCTFQDRYFKCESENFEVALCHLVYLGVMALGR